MIKYMLGYIQKESFIISLIPIYAKHFKHISRLQHREMGRNSPLYIIFFYSFEICSKCRNAKCNSNSGHSWFLIDFVIFLSIWILLYFLFHSWQKPIRMEMYFERVLIMNKVLVLLLHLYLIFINHASICFVWANNQCSTCTLLVLDWYRVNI